MQTAETRPPDTLQNSREDKFPNLPESRGEVQEAPNLPYQLQNKPPKIITNPQRASLSNKTVHFQYEARGVSNESIR